jgi:hypothetical protein
MNDATRNVVDTARSLTASQREAILDWANQATHADRYLALQAILDHSLAEGRYDEVCEAMDAAFAAVLESAGVPTYSYFAEGRAEPPPWDAAGELAAQAAAAESVSPSVPVLYRELLLKPWTALVGSRDIHQR